MMITVGCRRPWRDAFAAVEYHRVSCANGGVRFGSKPARLRTSRCFPVRLQSGPPRMNEHTLVDAPLNEQTQLISPFCVLSCNQSSSLFSSLLCRFRYSPVERFFYKFDGIDCCPKLNAKFVNRLIHRCWQLPTPINSATHCFFDGCYHLIDGDSRGRSLP